MINAHRWFAAACAAAIVSAAAPAMAQSSSPSPYRRAPYPPTSGPASAVVPAPPPPVTFGFVDEVKAGVLVHDVGFLGHHVEHGEDVNLEVLFKSPDFLRIIGSPRPHIGGDINTDGNTSDGYFGLTWGITLLPSVFGDGDSIFANGSLGGAVHDGYTTSAPDGRKRLGFPLLFRESIELGYQATPIISVSLFMDHISNANLAPRNAGITSAGARFGYKF